MWCTEQLLTAPGLDAQQLLSSDPQPASPQVTCWAWGHRIWNIWNFPLACWAQLSWLCPLLTSHAPPPAYLLGVRSWKILALVWALLSNHWISTLFSPWVHKLTLSQLKSGHTLFRANYNNSDPPGFMKPGHLYTNPWQNVARDILMKSQKSGIVN